MLVLIILDNRGNGLEDVVVALLHHILQVEVLDRDVIGAELEVAANRLEIGFLHLLAHLVFLGEVALDRDNRAFEQSEGVIGLGAVERRRRRFVAASRRGEQRSPDDPGPGEHRATRHPRLNPPAHAPVSRGARVLPV